VPVPQIARNQRGASIARLMKKNLFKRSLLSSGSAAITLLATNSPGVLNPHCKPAPSDLMPSGMDTTAAITANDNAKTTFFVLTPIAKSMPSQLAQSVRIAL